MNYTLGFSYYMTALVAVAAVGTFYLTYKKYIRTRKPIVEIKTSSQNSKIRVEILIRNRDSYSISLDRVSIKGAKDIRIASKFNYDPGSGEYSIDSGSLVTGISPSLSVPPESESTYSLTVCSNSSLDLSKSLSILIIVSSNRSSLLKNRTTWKIRKKITNGIVTNAN